MQLNPQEIQAALQFLNRVDLKGSEAEAMAMIKGKLGHQLQTATQPPPPPAPEGGDGEGKVTDLAGVKGEGKAQA